MCKPICIASLTLGIVPTASADSALGTISYMEGAVEVTRDGDFLSPRTVDIGLVIREFDTVETGEDAYVEVEMSAPAAGSLVKVHPGTAFYFEGTSRESSRFRTTFQLLRGALRLKVGRLASGESFNVQTDTAVMAVRGTEFTVDMAADRSILVGVPEGRVNIRSGTRSVDAEPGVVAFVDERSMLSAATVEPEDIDLYRQYWRNLRLDALKINAGLSIQQYARQWEHVHPRLETAMEELVSEEEIFRRWAAVADGTQDSPGLATAIRDKRELSRAFLELRATLPMAERTFQTLVGLEQAYRDGYAQGSFQAGEYADAAAFYQAFHPNKSRIRRMLSLSRRMVRLYRFIDRATGAFPDSSGPSLSDTIPTL